RRSRNPSPRARRLSPRSNELTWRTACYPGQRARRYVARRSKAWWRRAPPSCSAASIRLHTLATSSRGCEADVGCAARLRKARRVTTRLPRMQSGLRAFGARFGVIEQVETVDRKPGDDTAAFGGERDAD